MNTLKIGFDAKRAFYNQRGLGNYSRDTIRILSEQEPGNDYLLFTPKIKNAIDFPLQSNCKIITPSGSSWTTFSSAWRTFGQCKEIKREKLDIYHGLSHELPYGIEKCKVATVVTVHDLIFLKNPELFPFFDRYTFRKKYTKACKTADKIVAISQQTKRDLIEYLNMDEGRIEVVYQGCRPVFKQRLDEEAKKAICLKYNLPSDYMLIVCAIERRKNHEIILKAMHAGKIDLPLVIVGRPSEYKNELIRLITQYKLESNVIFRYPVETADLPAIYQSATLFVYPSLFEGFGIPILEALTSGVPVITSKGSCFEETGGNAACYVAHDDAEELADAIRRITENRELAGQMVEKGDIHAHLFSDESIAKALMAVYRDGRLISKYGSPDIAEKYRRN